MWFAISEAGLGPISAVTNTLLAGGRGRSGVEVGPDQIRVQIGDFKLTVPRASIRSVSRSQAGVGGTRHAPPLGAVASKRLRRWPGRTHHRTALLYRAQAHRDVHQVEGEITDAAPCRPRRIYRRPPAARSALTVPAAHQDEPEEPPVTLEQRPLAFDPAHGVVVQDHAPYATVRCQHARLRLYRLRSKHSLNWC